MATTKIHVNQHHLRKNMKAGNRDLPVFTIKKGGTNTYANELEIEGRCRFVYSDKPLSCGARIWIEVLDEHGIVVAKNAVAFKDI